MVLFKPYLFAIIYIHKIAHSIFLYQTIYYNLYCKYQLTITSYRRFIVNIALVLSGGTGTRLGSNTPKQYIKCNDTMIITYCLKTFSECNIVDGIWIVCNSDWRDAIIADYARICGASKILGFSSPGSTRQLSILNGLNDIDKYISESTTNTVTDSDPIVIIHDAARPNITEKLIVSGITSLNSHDGAMPVLPMKDTVYLSEDSKSVSSLLDRSKVYAGQAPEFFKLKKYLEANTTLLPDKIMSINGSTEPAIMAGLNVAMISGDERNYKITTKEDLDKFVREISVS